jgi:hypothetical protein
MACGAACAIASGGERVGYRWNASRRRRLALPTPQPAVAGAQTGATRLTGLAAPDRDGRAARPVALTAPTTCRAARCIAAARRRSAVRSAAIVWMKFGK